MYMVQMGGSEYGIESKGLRITLRKSKTQSFSGDPHKHKSSACAPSLLIMGIRPCLCFCCTYPAHELRAWLLHYSPVILHGILPVEYYQHHLLLVEGIFLLLKEVVTSEDIKQHEFNYLPQFLQ